MLKWVWLGFVALAMALAGCGEKSAEGGPAALRLTDDGLATVSAQTPFTVEAVRDALTGRDVRFGLDLDQPQAEQRVRITLRIHNEDQAHFFTDVFGRSVTRIEAVGERIDGPSGVHIGDRYEDLPGDLFTCDIADDEGGANAVCRPAGGERLELHYKASTERRRSGAPGDGAGLAGAILQRMVWRAPGAAEPKAGYECGRASGPVETAICGSAELAELDIKLNDLYGKVRTVTDEAEGVALRDAQRRWIGGRNDCWRAGGEMKACITDVYARRMGELRDFASEKCGRVSDEQGRERHAFTDAWWTACAAEER